MTHFTAALRGRVFTIAALLGLCASVLWLSTQMIFAAPSSVITVDTVSAENPLKVNGNCTFAEAIIAANQDQAVDNCPAGSGTDTIVLPAGQYVFTETLVPVCDPTSGCALPIITTSVVISGAGGASTILSRPSDAPDMRFVRIEGDTSVTIYGVTMQGGVAGTGGALIATQGTGNLRIEASRFVSNSSVGNGGATASTRNTEIVASDYEGNSAGNAGGAHYQTGTSVLTVTQTIMHSNSAASGGGALYNRQPTVLVQSSIYNNSLVTGRGGAIGSAILSVSSPLTMRNVTVSGNQGESAIYIGSNGSSFDISYSTIVSNTSGIRVNNTSNLTSTLSNSIVADNGGLVDVRHFNQPFVSGGYNLIGIADRASNNAFPATTGDMTGTLSAPLAPQLKPLSANRTVAQMTHEPLATSPAVDAIPFERAGCGDTVMVDQRGIMRPIWVTSLSGPHCDIGAHELEASTTAVALGEQVAEGAQGRFSLLVAGLFVLSCGVVCFGRMADRLRFF